MISNQDMQSEFKNKTPDAMNNIKEKACDYQEVLTEYIKEKPLKSMCIAILSGYLLGKMM